MGEHNSFLASIGNGVFFLLHHSWLWNEYSVGFSYSGASTDPDCIHWSFVSFVFKRIMFFLALWRLLDVEASGCITVNSWNRSCII